MASVVRTTEWPELMGLTSKAGYMNATYPTQTIENSFTHPLAGEVHI